MLPTFPRRPRRLRTSHFSRNVTASVRSLERHRRTPNSDVHLLTSARGAVHMIRHFLDRFATPALVVCCATVTALSVRQQFFPPAPLHPRALLSRRKDGPSLRYSSRPGWSPNRLARRSSAVGQICGLCECPFCSHINRHGSRVARDIPGVVSVTYRHMLDSGPSQLL